MHEDDVKLFLINSTQRQALYQAIHIDKSTKTPIFEWSSSAARHAYNLESPDDWSVWYDMVAKPKNVSILIYTGAFDMLDGPLTQPPWLQNLRSLSSDGGSLWTLPRKIFYVLNPTTQAYEVGGYYREDPALKFTFLTVPKSGHFVPLT